ncbi:Not1-domain-containing protein [Hymenopellis radicata]|nr:Not1-domain-containing protein [Hymenopellis radicata]
MDNPPTSTTNIHTIVRAQIVFLLSTLTEENFERNQIEIRSLSEQHGIDTYLHFIRRLIVHSQSRNTGSSTPSFDPSSSLTFRLLLQETQRLARDPFLADRFRDGIDKGEGDIFRHFDFIRFVERIGLNPLERLVLASSLASATRKELANQAVSVIKTEFKEAMATLYHSNPSFDHADLSPSQVAKLLSNLLSLDSPGSPILDYQERNALILAAQSKYGRDTVFPMLHHILPTLSLPPGTTLVQLLLQLGPELTSDQDVVRAVFTRFGMSDASPPRDAQVLDMFSALARHATEGTTLCDPTSLVKALASFPTTINWAVVIQSFDRPDRAGVDTATLKLLIAILLNCPRNEEPHAVTGFWTVWSNHLYQLRLLDALLSLPADTFNFVQLPGRRIVTVDDVAIASPTIKALAANVQGHTWNSLELFEVLVRLADSDSQEIRNCVREMLDKAIKISAELVHMGLLQVPDPKWNEIRLEYSRKLLAMFLGGHPNHQLVFMRIWQIEPTYLTNAFRDFYTENPLNITRILDVAQDLKILEALLEVRPFAFALDVAALASRREYLNLDKWLADNVTNHGAEFLHAIVEFLEDKMQNEKITRISEPTIESRTMALSAGTITIILRVLRNSSNLMDQEDLQRSMEVRNFCLQIHPRLMSLIPGSDVEPGTTVVNYSAEIETEVDGIYKQMYDESITIDEVIAQLQRQKESTNPRDHEVFSCMLHFLFDEYKFFQSYYPARELSMTGYLFGSLIHHQLIDSIPLGIAMRYVLDALQCPPETNLFKFGLQSLNRFENRLAEWRPLCEKLIEIPALAEAKPELVTSIQRYLATSSAEGYVNGDVRTLTIGQPSETVAAFTSIRPDSITEPIEEPPEELSDRILFIVNNLAPSNFDSKLNDMKSLFLEEHSRWFANYLVDQRISSEPNNHSLYLRFLDALESKVLARFILHETIVKSMNMLNSERTMQSGAERNALKNVGSWLGSITLARDRPIKHKNISFKDLLIEGYESGRLHVALPFVCKTLEGCSKSRVFKNTSPWLMAVISLLAEFYFFAELRLNPKFEIELLCTSLEIDLGTVEATSILRNRPLNDSMAGPPLPEYVSDINSLPIGGDYDPTPHMVGGDSQVLPLGPTSPAETQRPLGGHIEAILSALTMHVHVNVQLAPLNLNPTFKRAVQLAVDRSVRDIILPVVERSVTIAGISTRELVVKDFATEPNEDKLRKASHLMAQKLAGSLALVTCKEPLKSNLANHLRTYLVEAGFTEVVQQDQVTLILVQDNLEVACSAIEKAAMERAITDVDEAFADQYEARHRHREMRGQVFWAPGAQHTTFSNSLPDPLRIRPSGVQNNQLIVYDDFGVDPARRRVASRPGSAISYNPYTPSPAPDSAMNQPYISHQEAMDRFNVISRDLESVMIQIPNQTFSLLPQNHDVRHLVRQVIYLTLESADRARTPLAFSQKIVQLLYKTPTQLGRDVYEAINWLLYAEDERKLNVPVTVTLLASGLLSITLQDQQLAKSLYSDPRPSLLLFAANLIRQCLSTDPPILTQGQFATTLEVLGQLSQAGKVNEEVNRLLEDLGGSRRQLAVENPARLPSTKPDSDMREKLVGWFHQWVLIFQRSHSPEKSFVPFITQLTKQGILKAEEMSSLFFRVCAESSVSSYIKYAPNSASFQALDALSRLITYMIKYHGDATGVNNDQAKVHYLTKILSIFVLVLANMHEEQGVNFQQKPFFRFFSSLINDFHSMEVQLGSAYFQLLLALSDAFSSLQPTYFPGFSFSWMCLISHRLYMPKLLLSENREGWSAFHKLLLSLFKFLAPFLRDADLQHAAQDLYRGALRILLVLLHDFPEFLSEYYFTLCDAIPPRCIQLRNIILSAFPSSIILPDPHLRGQSMENIPETGIIPPILSDFTSGLKSGDLRGHLDQFLLNRGSPSFLPTLKDRLRPIPGPDGSNENYNLSLINSIVMYIGVSSVAQTKARSGSPVFVAGDPGVVALQYLASSLDVEGQHHLLSAVVLHLRYPNAHTHWFSSLLLHLFVEVQDDRFREVLTKVLLERFIVHRPHPWGALATFIELLRNTTKYQFWTKEFINIAPEVKLLLDSVAKVIFSP